MELFIIGLDRTNATTNMPRHCLVTISDPEFSIGTQVMLHSFFKYNPGFDGDVVVIFESLPEGDRARIQSVCNAKFVAPDPRLLEAVMRLKGIESRLEGIYRRLFSLEAFRLTDYERVVYLDSDMYCAGDLSGLFAAEAPLLACPDGFTYAEQIEARLEQRAERPRERYGREFAQTFNAGVLSLGPPVLSESTYLELLAWLQPEQWKTLGPGKFTDQMLLNVHFDGEFNALPAVYNYMIFLEEYQKLCEPVSFLDARIVHFAGALKPWFEYDPGVLAERAPQFIKFFSAWRELLNEVGGAPEFATVQARYRAQQEWIRQYNQKTIKPIGRLD